MLPRQARHRRGNGEVGHSLRLAEILGRSLQDQRRDLPPQIARCANVRGHGAVLMCNLYSMTTNVEAIRRLFQVDPASDRAGNLASMPGIYPDYKAPIVRNGNGGRELATARSGLAASSKALMDATKKRAEKLQAKGKPVDFKELLRMEPDGGTPHIRKVTSKHWTGWL